MVEGEKDADTLTALGYVATTMPGGAGHWLDIHTEALAGAIVDIVADNDVPGKEHAAKLLKVLTDAGCDAQIGKIQRLQRGQRRFLAPVAGCD